MVGKKDQGIDDRLALMVAEDYSFEELLEPSTIVPELMSILNIDSMYAWELVTKALLVKRANARKRTLND